MEVLQDSDIFNDLKTFDKEVTELVVIQEVINHFLFRQLKKIEDLQKKLKDYENGRIMLLKHNSAYTFIDAEGINYKLADFEKLNVIISKLNKEIFGLKEKSDRLSELKNYA